jgi:tetratricopeptide (TPR) repeat protein
MWSVVQPTLASVSFRFLFAPWLAVVALGTTACGTGARTRPPEPPKAPVIYATPTIVTPHDEVPAATKFEQARAEFDAARYREAGELFDQVVTSEPGGPLAPAAVFNAGLSWERSGDRERGLERFRAALTRARTTEDTKLAAMGAARLMAYFEQWSPLSSVADVLLGQPGLSDLEKLAGYGAKALAVVEAGDPESAERFVSKGLDIVEALRLGEGGRLPIEAAEVEFALGEIRKQRSERIRFVPFPPNFTDLLEGRCQGLLDAQSAYSEAMRSYDAHWAAMSGYRVGELYQRLHDDVMAIPAPRTADTKEKKQLFQGAMRLRYRILLEKGLRMMEHTLMLADRTGESSSWIDRARTAKKELEHALAQQKESLAQLPYTERQLEQALKDLAQKRAP